MFQSWSRSVGNALVVAGACVALLGLTGRVARAQSCVGDCDGNGVVAINELILGVNVALGTRDISVCEAMDCQGTGMVPINCLIRAVNNDVTGCPGVTRTPDAEGTPTPTGDPQSTPTPTGDTQATATATGGTPQGTPTPTDGLPGTPTATDSR